MRAFIGLKEGKVNDIMSVDEMKMQSMHALLGRAHGRERAGRAPSEGRIPDYSAPCKLREDEHTDQVSLRRTSLIPSVVHVLPFFLFKSDEPRVFCSLFIFNLPLRMRPREPQRRLLSEERAWRLHVRGAAVPLY